MLLVLLYFICIVGANEFPPEDDDPYNSNNESSDETSEEGVEADTSIQMG